MAVRGERLLRPLARARAARRAHGGELVAQGRVGDGKARVGGRPPRGRRRPPRCGGGEEALGAVVLGGGRPDRARACSAPAPPPRALPLGCHAHHDVRAGRAGASDRAQVVAPAARRSPSSRAILPRLKYASVAASAISTLPSIFPLKRRLRRAVHLERDSTSRGGTTRTGWPPAWMSRACGIRARSHSRRPRELPPALPRLSALPVFSGHRGIGAAAEKTRLGAGRCGWCGREAVVVGVVGSCRLSMTVLGLGPHRGRGKDRALWHLRRPEFSYVHRNHFRRG